MSIATGLLQSVLDAAADHGAGRIEEVDLQVGAMRLVVPEALEMAWSIVSEGTAAAGARLNVREVAVKAKCRACGSVFSPEIGEFLCRRCGQANVEIVEGDDIILRSIVCRSEEGASPP